MPGQEGRQPLRHAARVLQVQQVSRLGQIEGLGLGEPREQQLVTLAKAGVAVSPENGQHRLANAARLVGPKRPLPQRWKLLTEERVGVRTGLFDRVGHCLLEDGSTVRTDVPRRKVSTAADLSPARYNSIALGTSGGLGTAISAGSSKAIECTNLGAPNAS